MQEEHSGDKGAALAVPHLTVVHRVCLHAHTYAYRREALTPSKCVRSNTGKQTDQTHYTDLATGVVHTACVCIVATHLEYVL